MFERGSNKFDWDPEKAIANKAKHGLTFFAATAVFDDPHMVSELSHQDQHDEIRRLAIGMVWAKLFTVIFTDRGEYRRIISARRARLDERRRYGLRRAPE